MTTFDFLPENYELPASTGGNYMKIQDGNNKFRILAKPVVGWIYWEHQNTDEKGRPVRLHYTDEARKEAYEKAKLNPKKEDQSVKHFWAMKVYNYETDSVQILEITQKSLMQDIVNYAKDENWWSPTEYDINIKKEWKGLDTKYTFMPIPKKPLSDEIQAKVIEKYVNLEALFYGADPFDKDWNGVQDADIPF